MPLPELRHAQMETAVSLVLLSKLAMLQPNHVKGFLT
jgi:hypothetical protein